MLDVAPLPRAFAAICSLADLPPKPDPTLAAILHKVCEICHVPYVDVRSPRRAVAAVHARHIFYWLARKHTSKSFPQIGIAIGGKDHSSIIHGIHKVRRNFDLYAAEIEMVEKELSL
jgi:chromosomal replication initiator protein